MSRIAIVHYTLSPCIGGVESIIDAQTNVLLANGYRVRLIAGAGGPAPGAETVILPLMHPGSEAILSARGQLHAELPPPHHHLAKELKTSLLEALDGCDTICVHNALTLDLNPFLSCALYSLIPERRAARWSLWCEDISLASEYSGAASHPWLPLADLANDGVRFVTISEYRASQLRAIFDLPPGAVAVVAPPLHRDWLGLDAATLNLVRELQLLEVDPFVLVPAKLLPHKGLDRAVDLAHALSARFVRPLVLVTGAASPHDREASRHVLLELRERARDVPEGTFVVLADYLRADPTTALVRDLVMIADLVFLPSAEEGFGLPLLEACALRTPVLASDIPPFRESGTGWATFVGRNGPPEEAARVVEGIVKAPSSQARKHALRSLEEFQRRVLDLQTPSGLT